MQGTVWTWQLADKSDAAFRKLGKKFKGVDDSIDSTERKGKKLGKGMKNGFREAASEIPGLGRGIGLIKNPIVLAAGATLGFVAAAGKAAEKAREFNYEFLELKNLNLDKTKAEIDSLKDSVLDLSFKKGLDPVKTSKAFFDVQSATGLYGHEVELTVGKVGKFAQIMKADFNTSIEGAAKAMGIFNFKSDKMDEFLASSFKTVQVGVTTFDQLAKVQTEYAGAAASAGQGFNEANKLFAVFSANSKSVDIAANKTKTAFEDLGKKRTVDQFKKLGVNVFGADKNMRKLDEIAKDLVPRLKTMSDEDFSILKSNIGGSEGLRGLMDSLKNSGDKTLNTFKQFDDTEFSFDKALENARGDLEVMSQIIGNKLSVAWIKFGDAMTPVLLKIKNAIADVLDAASYIFGNAGEMDKKHVKNGMDFIDSKYNGYNAGMDFYKGKLKGLSKEDMLAALNFNETNQGLVQTTNKTYSKNDLQFMHENNGVFNYSKKFESQFAQADSVLKKRIEAGVSFDNLFDKKRGGKVLENPFKPLVEEPTPPKGTGGGSNSIAAGIMGAADKVRNVTVNIQNLVENFAVNKEGGTLAPEDIMRVVEEALVRAVNDAELTLSN